MNLSSAPNHAAHDELLLARLFGEDLEGPERERALELLDSCDECAAVYADFGALAGAVVGMRTPARPRDFALSEEAAAAARKRFSLRAALRGLRRLGPVRSFGAAMTAVGVAGMLAVGAVSALAPGQGSMAFGPIQLSDRNAAGAPLTAPSAGSSYKSASDQGELATAPALPSAGYGASPRVSAAGPTAVASANGPAAFASPPATARTGFLGAATPVPPAASHEALNGKSVGQGTSAPGPDARIAVLSGLGMLAAVGLVIVLAPSLGRRWRNRRSR